MNAASMQLHTTARQTALLILAAMAVAMVFALGMAATALASGAVTATGVDFTGNGGVMSTVEGGKVQVAEVAGQKGDTVFLTLKKGDEILAKNFAYTLGQNDDGTEDAGSWYGLVALDIAEFDDKALETGGYEVVLHSDRAGKTKIFDGNLYGVYAMIDGEKQLIGTRSVNSAEASRGFNPPATLYVDGAAYTTDGKQVSDTPAYTYIYSKDAGAGATVTGMVVFVYTDADGASHEITTIEQQVGENGVQVSIPETVADADGNRYRTIFSQDAVVLQNPGALSYTIYCAKMEREDPYNYMATIRMMDTDGNLIASDKVEVHGFYSYTAPRAIYKTETVDGEQAVVTYTRIGSGVVDLAADDVREAKGATVTYNREDPESAQVEVTFNLLDGTKEPSAKGRWLGVDTQVVSATATTAVPPASVTVNGKAYTLAGSQDDYAYTYRSGAMPVVNAYYVPEGYIPDSDYTVTVNYVNYANNQVLESRQFVSSPDDKGAQRIEAPEELKTGTDTYVRLAGQNRLLHSYYSGVKQYTVYYRNAKDTLPGGVQQVRVVYDPAPARAGSAGSSSSTASGSSSSAGSGSASGGAAGSGNATDDGADARLNQNGTYSTIDGEDGNASLNNEAGTDSTTERIDEEYPPLGQFDGEAEGGIPGGMAGIVAAAAAAIAVAVGIVMFLLRRRGDDEAANA